MATAVVTTPLFTLNSSTNASSYASNSATPTVGDCLTVVCSVSNLTDDTPTLTASANGITFSLAQSTQSDTNADRLYIFVADQIVGSSPSAMTVTLGLSGAATGAFICGLRVTGLTAVPTWQVAEQDNKAGSSAATFTFGSTTVSGNAVIVAQQTNNNTVPATVPSGFTENFNLGYTTPTSGMQVANRVTFAGTTVTWASNSGAGGALGIELLPSSSAIDLTINDATHAHSAESPTITQLHVVAPADATSAHTADAPTVTQVHVVQPADATHAHSAESPTISTSHTVSPNDATHGHTADSPTLTQTHVVAPADATHAHTADSPTVSVQAIEISPNDATHAHGAESPTVSQVHTVEPDDSTHGHTAESPEVLVVVPAPVPASRISTAPARSLTSTARASNKTARTYSRAVTSRTSAARRIALATPRNTTTRA